MKELKGWDAYVKEAEETAPEEDSSIKLPLTPDETYVIKFPTRRQGKAIMEAQESGDSDALVIALLGEEAGTRVTELSLDHPSAPLDLLLVDVLTKFGFIGDGAAEDEAVKEAGKSPEQDISDTPAPGSEPAPSSAE